MRKNKKIFSLLIVFTMFLSMATPIVTKADGGKEGSLSINKLYFPDSLPEELPEGTGEVTTELPKGAVPLEGAEFSIWEVADDAELPYTQSGPAYKVLKTNSDGLAFFDKVPYGRYYVVETSLPKGVTQGSVSFMVDIPTTSTDGKDLIDKVNVYPKNVLTLAKAQMTKVNELNVGLIGAEFDLYKVGNPDKKINDSALVTGPDGKTIVVSDLEVGDYYFIETKAPAGYLIDKTKQEFKIASGDHDKLFEKTLKDYEKPKQTEKTVDKTNAGIGDKLTWTIKTQLPNNIKTYTEYKISDTLHKALNYNNNLSIKVNEVELNEGSDYTLTEPSVGENGTIIINFTPKSLEKGNLEIKFDTIINEKAVAGINVENKSILDYNNGFEVGKETTPAVIVKVGGHQFKKVDNKLNKALQGAEFIVKRADGKYLVEDINGMISWGTSGQASKFTSGTDGLIKLNGLAFGDYFLIETKAPNGYSKLQNPVEFTVSENSHTIVLDVPNILKAKIPQTGGIGTLLFTVVGVGLMGLAAKTYKKERK